MNTYKISIDTKEVRIHGIFDDVCRHRRHALRFGGLTYAESEKMREPSLLPHSTQIRYARSVPTLEACATGGA
jgi:hypothetical protein